MPKNMRDKKSVVTDEAKMGVKNVIKDQHNTANVRTFFPPNFLEQLPPIILTVDFFVIKLCIKSIHLM